MGIGWYWFGPVAYVDTSDMWLAGKWPRVAVSLAGPYSNIVLAGAAALVGWFVGHPTIAAASVALRPRLLSRRAAQPHPAAGTGRLLRPHGSRSTAPTCARAPLPGWAASAFPALRREGWSGLRGHGVDLAYALLSLLFVAIMAAVTIALYRLSAQRWLEAIIPHGAAAGLAWVLAAVVVALALATTIGDLRGGHAATTG